MKKLYILLLAFGLFISSPVFSQKSGPPDPGSDPEISGDTPLGAPIGGGTLIMLVLGAAYGGRKIYQMKTEENKEK